MAGNSTRAPRIIGLTGPIGCGKTTVGDILLRLGARDRIDADTVVHELMAPGTPVTVAITEAFGTGILQDNGAVDRRSLATIVFADQGALRKLESITHPAVRAAIRRKLGDLGGDDGIVVVDAVKLLQGDLLPLCDEVWVVTCPHDEQTRRLVDIRGMTAEAAEARIAAQPSFDHPRVTRVIENTGSLDELRQQVTAAWREVSQC